MNSVLMIAYGFPPEGNAGVYRPLRFVRYLPYFGWRPTVVTLKADIYERYDPALLKQIPDGMEVIRVRNPDLWQKFLANRAKRVHEKISSASAEETAQILAAQQKPVRSRVRELVRSLEAKL